MSRRGTRVVDAVRTVAVAANAVDDLDSAEITALAEEIAELAGVTSAFRVRGVTYTVEEVMTDLGPRVVLSRNARPVIGDIRETTARRVGATRAERNEFVREAADVIDALASRRRQSRPDVKAAAQGARRVDNILDNSRAARAEITGVANAIARRVGPMDFVRIATRSYGVVVVGTTPRLAVRGSRGGVRAFGIPEAGGRIPAYDEDFNALRRDQNSIIREFGFARGRERATLAVSLESRPLVPTLDELLEALEPATVGVSSVLNKTKYSIATSRGGVTALVVAEQGAPPWYVAIRRINEPRTGSRPANQTFGALRVRPGNPDELERLRRTGADVVASLAAATPRVSPITLEAAKNAADRATAVSEAVRLAQGTPDDRLRAVESASNPQDVDPIVVGSLRKRSYGILRVGGESRVIANRVSLRVGSVSAPARDAAKIADALVARTRATVAGIRSMGLDIT